jgi:alpha-N-arabinofuranosidase
MNRRRFLQSGSMAAMGALASSATAAPSGGLPAAQSNSGRARLTVVPNETLGTISRNVYGQFTEHLGSCVYGAMWVGPDSPIPNHNGLRSDTIEAFKRIHAPIIRWPGGCFADTYHWRDGIGPREKRPRTWNIFWDRDESNEFGTDEFMEYCRLCGASPYVCLNVGSGTVREALGWLEYCNGDQKTTISQMRAANGHAAPYNVKYWSVGNENWGCGGRFDAEEYGRRYARFVNYLGTAARRANVEFVACGDMRDGWNQTFFETLLRRPGARRVEGVNHLSVHHYFFNREPAVNFNEQQYYNLLAAVDELEALLRKTIGIIDNYTEGVGPTIGIALDEWGVWHRTENTGNQALLQPNTVRDALVAAVVLNSLNNFGDRITIGCIAQAFNVLQCMAFTRGGQIVLTPTFYVFDLYQPHMDAMALRTLVDSASFSVKMPQPGPPGFQREREIHRPYLSASASLKESQLCLTLVNQHMTEPLEVEIQITGSEFSGSLTGTQRQLTSKDARDQNTFEEPNVVKASQEKTLSVRGNQFVRQLAPHSVETLILRRV